MLPNSSRRPTPESVEVAAFASEQATQNINWNAGVQYGRTSRWKMLFGTLYRNCAKLKTCLVRNLSNGPGGETLARPLALQFPSKLLHISGPAPVGYRPPGILTPPAFMSRFRTNLNGLSRSQTTQLCNKSWTNEEFDEREDSTIVLSRSSCAWIGGQL